MHAAWNARVDVEVLGRALLDVYSIDCALPLTMMSMRSACSLADTAFIAPFFAAGIAREVFATERRPLFLKRAPADVFARGPSNSILKQAAAGVKA